MIVNCSLANVGTFGSVFNFTNVPLILLVTNFINMKSLSTVVTSHPGCLISYATSIRSKLSMFELKGIDRSVRPRSIADAYPAQCAAVNTISVATSDPPQMDVPKYVNDTR